MMATEGQSVEKNCQKCGTKFGLLSRKHKCKACVRPFCHKCSMGTAIMLHLGHQNPVRICDYCRAEFVRMAAPSNWQFVPPPLPPPPSSSSMEAWSVVSQDEPALPPPTMTSRQCSVTSMEKPEKLSEADEEKELELAISLSLEEHRRMIGLEKYADQELAVVKAISLAEIQQEQELLEFQLQQSQSQGVPMSTMMSSMPMPKLIEEDTDEDAGFCENY